MGHLLRRIRVCDLRWRVLGVVLAMSLLAARPILAGLPRAEPESVGFDAQRLQRIDEIVAEGLAQKKMPGCVVCVGRQGKIAFLKAYGQKQLQPNELPMTTDTVFDMASITKPMATATSIMLLIERGQLRLSDKIATLIPEFAVNDKDAITI
ncbi:MAG: hypothetical protein FD138_2923, partial [Planctomycetota bacterium]